MHGHIRLRTTLERVRIIIDIYASLIQLFMLHAKEALMVLFSGRFHREQQHNSPTSNIKIEHIEYEEELFFAREGAVKASKMK